MKELDEKLFKGTLLQKILVIVFIVLISCSVGAVISGVVTDQRLAKSINSQIDDSFEKVFAKIDAIFVRFEDIATDNIRKTSGLFSLEQVWGIFTDGQKRYEHEAKVLIDKRLSQLDAGGSVDKENVTSLIHEDLDALSARIDGEVKEHARDYVRHSIEKIGSANVTLGLSQEGAQREITDIHVRAIASVKKSIQENQSLGMETLLFSMMFIALVISLIAFWMARTITRPISMMAESFNEMATTGKQLKSIRMSVSGEMKQLLDAFNRMIANLHKVTASRDVLNKEIEYRQRAEEAMQQAKDEAEAANKAKSEFLANMSHEIRTPLNAILGFSDLLGTTNVDEQQKSYLSTITTSSGILISVINDILDLSKLEAGKVQLESIDFDLGNLVNDVFNMAKIRFKEQDINPYIDWDMHVPQWVKGDPTRIRQILLNFLNNAVKFTSKGEIGVIVRLEQTTSHGPVINFCVKDSGIGIPADKKTKLFASFSQVDSSTTRKYGGTGLGLAISKKLVDVMGGKVWLESEEGHGSQFFFTVPFEAGTSLVGQAIDPLTREQLINKLVLCVDDHPPSLEIISRYCQEIDLKVIKASGALEALQVLDKCLADGELPDLILSDIRMPDMDGYMLAEKIRTMSKFDAIKIVATTSDARVGGAVFAQEKGFNAYLPKPVMRNDLTRIISTVLGDKRPISVPIITRHVANEVELKGLRVLVVDDVLSNQQLMKAYLDMFGCISDLAVNGQEAIDKLKSSSYDICLMDVQMPVLDGLEATRIIRAQISKDLPIIALTAAVMKEEIEKTKAAGMNDFLTKPLEINTLRTMLIKFV